jgi:hypothetical protein
MAVTFTEATKQRLINSTAVFGPPKVDMSALDLLAVPKNFDDLIMQMQAKDCNMFFPMIGLPRAYMEIPILNGHPDPFDPSKPEVTMERWVYRVFNWWAKGTRSQTEVLLCEAAWKDFVELRKLFATFFGDAEPVIVWRRQPEFEEIPAQRKGVCFEHNKKNCRDCAHGPISLINMRFAIPGLDIQRHKQCTDNPIDRSAHRFDPRFEVKPEPVK